MPKSKKSWKQSSTYQMLFGSLIVPRCVPFYYRLYLLLSKLRRSLSNHSKKTLIPQVTADEKITGSDNVVILGDAKGLLINKTYSQIEEDLKRQDVQIIVKSLDDLKNTLTSKGLRFTSAAGSFKHKDFVLQKERNKTWENSWALANSDIKKGDTVLDLGGASTIFSYYLASRGCSVYCVDNDWGCHGIVYNARYAAKKMNWPLKICNRDLALELPFADNFFDKVFCICVLEHLSSSVRKSVMKEIKRVLKPQGQAALTFDYDERRNDPRFDKGIRYSTKNRLVNDIVVPSGLKIVGNQALLDDCPQDFFLGSLFLKKD